MNHLYTKLFLRVAVAAGFLSAVADRFGLWSENISAWGNWENFEGYTHSLLPFLPETVIPFFAWTATLAEIVFGILLLIGLKTQLVAKLSGVLLILFALAMTISLGIKAPLDYSVLPASAAAFAISVIKGKYLELDMLLNKN
ncbi:DoxX family membrane protein [Galbibacter sp. EGI 63066]|uniref:DoxX family membrane protein n=1 Tax=Galbibacter sp. EGI 63066 TaxID=2993559 RepID=UPI00224968D0|nr:DoxX family membrane protein [Galbibacter sp. EGI 63066]MCX2681707.1 DoxX family membrane protein [Galbibacter sp. EGI 63066]